MFAEQRIGEILNQLSKLRYPDTVRLSGWKMRHTDKESRFDGQPHEDWINVDDRSVWGGDQEYLVFENTIEIPAELAGKTVEFMLMTGREGEWDATNPQFTVYVDHVLRQGFDVNHENIRLTDCAEAGEKHHIFLSAFTGTQNFHLDFASSLRSVDLKVLKFYYDLLIPWEIACTLDKEEYSYIHLMEQLTRTVNLIDFRKPGSEAFYRTLAEAEAYLKQEFYTHEKETEAQVICVGHTHIDVAWKWTLAVTQDKAVRSFSTVLELMKRYPDYIFMSSQPQLYQYVKKNAPEIYEQVKERVKEGRWEVEGGMWVEPDCNLASGEALIRQLFYGKKFFREEFGRENQILWLPDVFGYSAALPQILKKSGIDYFQTTKISWNEVNKVPYDSFYWQGIDGTKILTHFITTTDYVSKTRFLKTSNEFSNGFTTNYNGYLNPCMMRGTWQRYQQKDLSTDVLCSFGYGDGGGGPTEEMLETAERLKFGFTSTPKVKLSTATDFFRRLEKNIQGKKVPVWSGELYLEYHRATYTSMARNKRYNRKSEFLLTNLEAFARMAEQLTGSTYPKKVLDEKWEVLLRNQFHDILPGSSIFQVYEDSKQEYEELFAACSAELDAQLQKLADHAGGTVVFNPNGTCMSGLAEADFDPGMGQTQKTAQGTWLVHVEHVPAKGYARLGEVICRADAEACRTAPVCQITENSIETPYASIRFNEKGQICFWYDKTQNRSLLQEGTCGNVLIGYEDKPFQYDNWNLFDYYKEKGWEVDELVSAAVVEEGPLRYGLKLVWKYLDSTIEEIIYAYPDSAKIDFVFTADWKESQIFLKTLFPIDLNSREATYEIQYGNVKRPTTYNTSWEAARFEVCYHKWMDVAESGYGVSFLNDCKYGVSVEENVVGLSLIKCGLDPNPYADKEIHHATYSVLPHEGSWQDAEIVSAAYLLNNPMILKQGAAIPDSEEIEVAASYTEAYSTNRNIMVEVVKKEDAGDGTVIRFYEFENRRTNAELKLGRCYQKIWLADLMEKKQTLLAENTDTVIVPVKPFEIMTVIAE